MIITDKLASKINAFVSKEIGIYKNPKSRINSQHIDGLHKIDTEYMFEAIFLFMMFIIYLLTVRNFITIFTWNILNQLYLLKFSIWLDHLVEYYATQYDLLSEWCSLSLYCLIHRLTTWIVINRKYFDDWLWF